MSHPERVADRRTLLALPGVPLVFAASSLVRLSYATLVLSLLLTVQAATGSYAVAGTALGAYGVTSFVMPLKSRLLDRFGPRRVVPWLSVGFAVAASSLAWTSSPVLCCAAAVAAGSAAPPVGPTVRAAWARLTPEPAARQRAYSLDAVVESTLFAAGPVVATGTTVALGPAGALAVTAGTHLLGSVLMSRSPLLTPVGVSARPSRTRGLLGPLTRPGYAVLLLFAFGTGLANDPLEVAVVARGEQGSTVTAGLLLAVLSISAAVAGLTWGHVVSRRWFPLREASDWTVLGVLATVTAVAAAVAALGSGSGPLVVALVLVGFASAPLAVVTYTAADRLGGQDGGSEVTSWVNTATNLGASLGTAGAGLLVESHGVPSAFWAAAVVAGLAGGGAWLRRSRERPRRDPR